MRRQLLLVHPKERNQLHDLGLDVSYRNRLRRRGLDSSGAGKEQKVGYYEHGKQSSASKNDGNFVNIRGNTCFSKRAVFHEVSAATTESTQHFTC
jgi:hypothetical protein